MCVCEICEGDESESQVHAQMDECESDGIQLIVPPNQLSSHMRK